MALTEREGMGEETEEGGREGGEGGGQGVKEGKGEGQEIEEGKEEERESKGAGGQEGGKETNGEEEERQEEGEREGGIGALARQGLDPTINSRLRCPHGNLLPHARKSARLLPRAAWSLFTTLFPGAISFSEGTPPCPRCQESKQSLAEVNMMKKVARDAEVKCKELRELARRKTAYPPVLRRLVEGACPLGGRGREGEGKFMIVGRGWLRAWREYVRDYKEKPKPLVPDKERGVRCVHGLLKLPFFLTDLLKTGEMTKDEGGREGGEGGEEEREGEEGEADLVTPAEWERLLESYAPEERQKAQEATVILRRQVCEVEREGGREGGWVVGATFSPLVCSVCQAEREAARERARITYRNQPLKVVVLKNGEEPPDAPSSLPPSLPPSGSTSTGNGVAVGRGEGAVPRTALRRTRGSRGRGRKKETKVLEGVSSTDDVQTLKLRVWEVLSAGEDGVSISLIWKGRELSEGRMTLGEAGVRKDGVVYARVEAAEEGLSVWETADLEGGGGGGGGGWEDPAAFGVVVEDGEGARGEESKGRKSYRPEQGFHGTFLASLSPSHPPVRNQLPSAASSSPPSSPSPLPPFSPAPTPGVTLGHERGLGDRNEGLRGGGGPEGNGNGAKANEGMALRPVKGGVEDEEVSAGGVEEQAVSIGKRVAVAMEMDRKEGGTEEINGTSHGMLPDGVEEEEEVQVEERGGGGSGSEDEEDSMGTPVLRLNGDASARAEKGLTVEGV
jgi:hypothetical protein